MTNSIVNGRFRVELSENVDIQKTKRAELAKKVQKTALIILFSVGIMAATAAGDVALAVLLSALAKALIFEKEDKDHTPSYKNPIDRPYIRLLEITLDSSSIQVHFI